MKNIGLLTRRGTFGQVDREEVLLREGVCLYIICSSQDCALSTY